MTYLTDLQLGPCCACGIEGRHLNLMMLDQEAPPGFDGWGCVVCGLPSRGAMAVCCDACAESGAEIKYVCGGRNVADAERVPITELEYRPHAHDAAKHADDGERS